MYAFVSMLVTSSSSLLALSGLGNAYVVKDDEILFGSIARVEIEPAKLSESFRRALLDICDLLRRTSLHDASKL